MMRCRRILLAIVLICLSLFQLSCISTPPPLPSHNTLVKSEPLTFDEFMASYLPLLPISEGGLYGTFDGELIQIPQELQKELVKYFPDLDLPSYSGQEIGRIWMKFRQGH